MITIKALPLSRRPSLQPRASSQGFAQSIMQKYRHAEGRDPGYLALIHRDFSPSIGGQENHFHQTFIHVRMQVQVDSYLGLNREMLPNGQAGLPGSKERVVMTQASGSGRKVRPAAFIHELFQKWASSKIIEKVSLPQITVVSKGRDRYRWSSNVQSSVQRGSSLEKWLPLGRFKEQIHPADFASPLLKAMVSDSKETVRESFWTPETSYVSPELWVHTARMGDPGELRSLQYERERIRLESAAGVDAISIPLLRATRFSEVRFEQSGVRYFLQLIRKRMEPEMGTRSFPDLLKRAEGRATALPLDRSVWTVQAGIDGRDITRRIVHESENIHWSVASQQTELWGRWWKNLSLHWQQSRETRLPMTMIAHPRLHVLQPIVFPRSRQHPQAKNGWMLETLSDVSFIPLEQRILQSNGFSKMFTSLMPSMFHPADTGRTKQQAVRERFKQLFHLAKQFPQAESERGLAALGSRQRLKQIERGRNQRTYELLQQLISQEARLNEIAREQSIRLESSHEQTHFGKTSVISAMFPTSYQQPDMLQQEWRTGLSLHLLHSIQGIPFPLQPARITDSSRTVPLLSQSVVKKSITAYWIESFRSGIDPVFFEKRGWLNQPWMKEHLATHNEIEREPAGIASTARFVWERFVPVFRVNRFAPIFHTNRQRWQTLQNRIVSTTHHKTNGKSVMEWVHLQQMAAKQLRTRELHTTRFHAPRNLLYEPGKQPLHPAASTPEGISQPFFQPVIHFLQNKHLSQMSYGMVRQLLSFQGGKDMQTDVAFSFAKNQEKFSLPGRKATISMVHEHEHRPLRHAVFLNNERRTSRSLVLTRRHDQEALFLRLKRFGSAMLRTTEWIGPGGADHQRLYNTSAKPLSMREDVFDRNSLRRIAAGWSAELGLTILMQKSAKLVALSEFAKLASTSGVAKLGTASTSRKAPPSNEKQSNDQSRSRMGESNLLRESRQSREISHSRFFQQTASLMTRFLALRVRPYLQVMEQIRKAIQTDFRTEAYVQNHHSFSTVLNRHDAQMVVQKQWGPLHSLVHQSMLASDSFIHESGRSRAIEPLQRKDRVSRLEPLSHHHPISSAPFSRETSIDFVLDRLHARQLSRRRLFQQTNHDQTLTVNQKTQTINRLTSDKTQRIEVRDARLMSLQRPGRFNLKPTAMTMQLQLLQRMQQAQRRPGESEQRSLSKNATHIHRRALRTADSHTSPVATVQSPPSMEYLRKSIPPQETAVQQATTLPPQRQVDLHVQERTGNQTSLSPQEVDRLMDKMMKELDKRLTQERQRRGL
ncbi:hypothetical protein BBR47_42140 [Brevibacillus brevis NBRC 100599]|uniref:Uncharacterized protein n=1 Tax=Brevibacillus brevis (strain 47 / JCM 6285 / NBRC 100599) TaxID=358681 RepID=C0ZHR7_BREBN|nr:hypothetical protein [Brevibacillus brevis]BAH45191.1 hypothetical protein BBR47_42140 [Brevibacillus brevis NBRC 100599]